jgi:hypothetical protein
MGKRVEKIIGLRGKMPRIACLIVRGEPAAYNVISQTAFDGFVLGDFEKDYLLSLIKRLRCVYFVRYWVSVLWETISTFWPAYIRGKI